MTTKYNLDGSIDYVAYLGDTWGHCPTERLLLYWDKQNRKAALIKAPCKQTSQISFQVSLYIYFKCIRSFTNQRSVDPIRPLFKIFVPEEQVRILILCLISYTFFLTLFC